MRRSRLTSALVGLILTLHSPCLSATPRVTPDEVLFKVDGSSAKATLANDLNDLAEISPVFTTRALRKPAPHISGVYKGVLRNGTDLNAVLAKLRSRGDVVYARPNHIFRTFLATNDPRLDEQFHLDLIDWPVLNAALPPKQKDIIVGIIDSGIDADHEDLADWVWVNSAELNGRPGVDDDQNGYVDDIRGWDFTDAPSLPGQGDFTTPDNDPSDESSHGTQVAGVIGAIADNGKGVAGVADCTLMAIRAGLNFDQGGTFLQEDDLAAAIIYAVDNGAHVLNLSWGSFDRAFVIEDAVRYATERGVVIVAAAGNSGQPPVAYPAALDEVISVSAVETTGQLASFGSFGPTLDLVAPGVNIVSTRLDDTYGPRSGSSFAAPQISGLAALLLSRQPDLSAGEVSGALVASTDDLGENGWDERFGAGQIDAAQLLPYVTGTQTPTVARLVTPTVDDAASTAVSISASIRGSNATNYRLSWARDASPLVWTLIESGPASVDIAAQWAIPQELVDAPVVLRLEADASNEPKPIEHRVRLRANPAIPEIISLFLGPILEGDRSVWRARWVTRNPTTSQLILISESGFVRDTIATAKLDRFHEAVLPDNGQIRNLEFQIEIRDPSGIRTITPVEPITLVPGKVPSIGFRETATLPDGFLADRTSDFDSDRNPEIALMPYVAGQAFSPVEIFEYADGAFTSIHTMEASLLPWNVGDVNHDGTQDLLGSSVARVQLFSGTPVLSSTLLDQTGVWGGEIADADGDGANDILTRSLADHTIRVFRTLAGSPITEVASLVDFSSGIGEMGSRFVVGDLDGDLKQDLFVGDADGDLWSYEFDGGAFTPNVLLPGDDDTDARVIGGGSDLDGDGAAEFAVARAFPKDSDALNGWWDLEIYGNTANNQYTLEYVQRISGVTFPGNGMTTGDLDGDGRDELAVALIPDLYVIRADGPNTYRPIYHTPISLTYQPVIADFDDDGMAELLFNANGAIRILERDQPMDAVQRPEILSTVPLGRDRISVTWMATPGATAYRLTRAAVDTEIVVSESPALSFIDVGVPEAIPLTYTVEAIVGSSTVPSGPVSIASSSLPTVVRLDRLDENRLGVIFNAGMSDVATDPNGYRLTPPGLAPSSAIRDQSSRRIILTFDSPINEGTAYTLDIRSATSLAGALVDPGFRSVKFTPGQQSSAAAADFDADNVVGFSDFLLFAAAFGGNDPAFDLDDDNSVGFSDFLIFAGHFGQTV